MQVQSRLYRFDIEHFVRGAKARGFVEASAFFGGVEGHNADVAPPRFGEGIFDEVAGEMAAAIIQLDVDVEEVAAGGGARVEGMRRPVEQKQARAGDDLTVVFSEPAEIAVVGDGLCDPRFVCLNHELEDLIVSASGINKHAATMTGDERSVGGRRQPGFQHDEQYKT